MSQFSARMLFVCLLCPNLALAQSSTPVKREQFQNANVIYDWVTDTRGERLRMFVTRPKAIRGKVPSIFFVGWLSCDSVEYPEGETDGFGAIFHRLIEQSGPREWSKTESAFTLVTLEAATLILKLPGGNKQKEKQDE